MEGREGAVGVAGAHRFLAPSVVAGVVGGLEMGMGMGIGMGTVVGLGLGLAVSLWSPKWGCVYYWEKDLGSVRA